MRHDSHASHISAARASSLVRTRRLTFDISPMKKLLLCAAGILLLMQPLIASDLVWGAAVNGVVLGVPHSQPIALVSGAGGELLQPLMLWIKNNTLRPISIAFHGRFECLDLFLVNAQGENVPLDPTGHGAQTLKDLPAKGVLQIHTMVPRELLADFRRPLSATVTIYDPADRTYTEAASPEIHFKRK